MTGVVLLALIAVGTVPGAHLLSRARWTWRTPRTGIVLWQALGLAWGVASIGTLLGLAVHPYDRGVAGGLLLLMADVLAGRPLDSLGTPLLVALGAGLALVVVLLTMLLYAIVGVVRARRRHRALLALVAHGEPSVPGTLVLDHPAAAAYCVPGVRSSKVVVSAGTLQLLDPAELAAVLAHERAHARERHDLVLLPFASLRQIFPRFGLVTRSLDAVALLVEMAADDRARRHRPPRELATALLRFAAAGPAAAPSGALAAIEVWDTDVPSSLPATDGDAAPAATAAQGQGQGQGPGQDPDPGQEPNASTEIGTDAGPAVVAPGAAPPGAAAGRPATGRQGMTGTARRAWSVLTAGRFGRTGTTTGSEATVAPAATVAAGTGIEAGAVFSPGVREASPVIARVHRLIEPAPAPPGTRVAVLAAALVVAVVPPLIYTLPF